MEKEFDPENTHEQNVKIAIDKIIGEPTNIKKKKKSELDQKRILFKKIIDNIIEAEQRNSILNEMFSIDLNKNTSIYFDIIEDFLSYSFTKDQIKLINFYLYDRYSADGAILDLLDANENPIKLDTSEDLWHVIKAMDNGPKS